MDNKDDSKNNEELARLAGKELDKHFKTKKPDTLFVESMSTEIWDKSTEGLNDLDKSEPLTMETLEAVINRIERPRKFKPLYVSEQLMFLMDMSLLKELIQYNHKNPIMETNKEEEKKLDVIVKFHPMFEPDKAKALREDKEEMKRCSEDPYYFFMNYWTINGKKPTISREEYEKLAEVLNKERNGDNI